MCAWRRQAVSSFRRQESAAAQALAFMVAGTIFIASTATILLTIPSLPVDNVGPKQSAMDAQARSMLDVLQGSNAGPGRPGLANAHGHLDYPSIGKMRGGGYDKDPTNDKTDYVESREAFGIEAHDLDFNLRISPLHPLTVPKSELRIALIVSMPIPNNDDLRVSALEAPLPADAPEVVRGRYNTDDSEDSLAERDALTVLQYAYDDRINLVSVAAETEVEQCLLEVCVYESQPLADVVSPELLEGDVYPDTGDYLELALLPRLDQYHAVIVGTNVDASELDSPELQAAWSEWIHDGGMLVVVGSGTSSTAWLESTLSGCSTTPDTSPHIPDRSHPMLTTPHALGKVPVFADKAMKGLGNYWHCFNHLDVNPGVVDGQPDPWSGIAVSKVGSLQLGHIAILATEGKAVDRMETTHYECGPGIDPSPALYEYMPVPDSIGPDGGVQCSDTITSYVTAARLIENILHYLYHADGAYLLFGQLVPDDAIVGYSQRILNFADAEGYQIIVRAELRVWRS